MPDQPGILSVVATNATQPARLPTDEEMRDQIERALLKPPPKPFVVVPYKLWKAWRDA